MKVILYNHIENDGRTGTFYEDGTYTFTHWEPGRVGQWRLDGTTLIFHYGFKDNHDWVEVAPSDAYYKDIKMIVEGIRESLNRILEKELLE